MPEKFPVHLKAQRLPQAQFIVAHFSNYRRKQIVFYHRPILKGDIAQDIKYDIRFQHYAIMALQHASEAYPVEGFQKEPRATRHAERITPQDENINLVNEFCDSWTSKALFSYPVCFYIRIVKTFWEHHV